MRTDSHSGLYLRVWVSSAWTASSYPSVSCSEGKASHNWTYTSQGVQYLMVSTSASCISFGSSKTQILSCLNLLPASWAGYPDSWFEEPEPRDKIEDGVFGVSVMTHVNQNVDIFTHTYFCWPLPKEAVPPLWPNTPLPPWGEEHFDLSNNCSQSCLSTVFINIYMQASWCPH